MLDEPDVIDAEATTALATTAREEGQAQVAAMQAVSRPISLKNGLSLLPVAQQEIVLAEYDARRVSFRRWLMEHLVQGIHYGVPPGCEIKVNAKGEILQFVRGKERAVPRDQWRAKPSLYKAGALLLMDLLKLRATFQADKDAWEQLGSKPGHLVFECELVNPATGEVVGEGRGVFEVGEKKMGSNAAIKMSQKRALIDAVLRTTALADLFTQDMEPAAPSPRPDADPNAPAAPTRGQRAGQGPVSADELKALAGRYKRKNPNCEPKHFLQWVTDQIGEADDWLQPPRWTRSQLAACMEALQ